MKKVETENFRKFIKLEQEKSERLALENSILRQEIGKLKSLLAHHLTCNVTLQRQ